MVVLSSYISRAGFCARRKAACYIKRGVVTVDGVIITNPSYRIKGEERVSVDGKVIKQEPLLYVLLNKPKKCITTVSDEKGRKTVMHLVQGIGVRLYPVGRLDYNTTGLLLLTNDGYLAECLSHPRYNIKKTYMVTLDRTIELQDQEKLRRGVSLPDGKVILDSIDFFEKDKKNCIKLVLHSGKYRVIRRLFNALGYTVVTLKRIGYAQLRIRDLGVGSWRFLTSSELRSLRGY